MTRKEQICDVAKEQFTCIKDENLKLSLQLAFVAGAKWADKNPFVAWRNVSEEPNNKDAELIIDSDVGIRHYTFNYMLYKFGSSETWQTICLHMGIKQWAYVNDIITK